MSFIRPSYCEIDKKSVIMKILYEINSIEFLSHPLSQTNFSRDVLNKHL